MLRAIPFFIIAPLWLIFSFPVNALSAEKSRMIDLYLGRADLIQLSDPATRISVGDPRVADVTLINKNEVYILGKRVGVTNLIYWDKLGRSSIHQVNVSIDTDALVRSINDLFPDEKDISVKSSSDSVVLSGSVSNVIVADAIVDLANSFMRGVGRLSQQGNYQESTSGSSASVSSSNMSSSSPQPSSLSAGQVSSSQVINLLKIRDAQQVMLEVKIAEISKSLLEKLGLNLTDAPAKWSIINNTASVGNVLRAWDPTQTINSSVGLATPNDLGKLHVGVDAQKNDGLVKILAEPSIVAISGQEGSFNVGGRLFIPQYSSTGAASTKEVPYGIGVTFLPTVLDGGRINLKVNPEVSEVGQELVLRGAGTTTIIPTLTTRTVSTTVQLKDGQSLVLGGLLKNNITETIKAFPILGELPILGVLFRSKQFVSDKSELVILITPSLVGGVNSKIPLPTDKFKPPTRKDFFLGSGTNLEGKPTEQSEVILEKND
jgi:pilus assembly protein CpaC